MMYSEHKQFTFDDQGKKIETKEFVKDLGVIMKNDCSFVEHINKIVVKTKELSSWILRTFKSRDRHLMLTLCKNTGYTTL